MRSHARDPAFKELFTMKKILSAAMAVLLMLFTVACSRPEGQAPVDTEEPVTIPPITVPDEPDDRTFTDTAPYAERLESLFASNPTAPVEDFTYEVTDDGVTVTAYTGGEVVVVIPDTIEDKPVTAIGYEAFRGCSQMTSISIILMFPTLIASIFGMNLINGMETSWWGFPLVIVSSISVTALFYWIFRRRTWI